MMLPQHIIPISFFVALAVAILLIAFKPGQEPAEAKEKARTIESTIIQQGVYAASIPLFAQVTTPHHAHIKSAVTADVSFLHQLTGQSVNQGDLLLELDNREASLIVSQRSADVKDLAAQIENENLQHENQLYVVGNKQDKRSKHNRAQIIKEHEIRLTSLAAKQQRAEALLQLAHLDLHRTKITAPFSGQITALHVSTGDRVRPGDALIDMYDKIQVEITSPLPGRHVEIIRTALANNNKLIAYISNNGHIINASLDRLAGQVSERSGTVNAFFKVIQPSHTLTLGQQLHLSLNLPPTEQAFIVPSTALYGSNHVYKIIDNRLKAVAVNVIGDYASDNPEPQLVLNSPDIKDGDHIMTTQLPDAIENLLIKAIGKP